MAALTSTMDPDSCPEQALSIFLDQYAPTERLWVAFSGGLDSTALLVAASAVCASRTLPLVAVHVDHQLQPDSAAWSNHCRSVCEALGVAYESYSVTVSDQGSLEAAARQARYRALTAAVPETDLLCLAHHADDQLESRLLRLFQGRGMQGMATFA